jgi:allophanate hydrolase subunit 1
VGNLDEELFVLAIHARGRYHHAMQVVPAGDNAFLVELGEVSAAELHAAARDARSIEGVIAVIPGHSSLYVIGKPARSLDTLSTRRHVDSSPSLHVLRVSFANAPDLDELLSRIGVTLDAFLARVATLRLTVRYLGFRGGFAYLDGWPEEWAMPRRPTSRPFVPRGTFAIAGNVAGFYPIDSPGGWNLLGRTDKDLEYALSPGDRIQIEPRRDPLPSPRARGEGQGGASLVLPDVDVLSAPLAKLVAPAPDWTLVEHGRPPGGPFDDMAAALAMRAVDRCDALVECAMAGPRLHFRREAVIAWCTPDLQVDVRRVRQGEVIALGRITGGLRAYLAIGRAEGVIAKMQRDDRHVIHAMRGPHDVGLADVECEVTPQLDRVGVRLRPLNPIDVTIPADLRSCGMQCGTIQLHPDGSLIAMGPDHPVTGGYLQPMTVLTSERWKLGQVLPGERVTFRNEAGRADMT